MTTVFMQLCEKFLKCILQDESST